MQAAPGIAPGERGIPPEAAHVAATDAASAAAAVAAAAALENEVLADSNDEDDEVDNFGAGAIERARLSADGFPHFEDVAYGTEANARAARRRTTRNISADAMSEQSWTANENVAARLIRILVVAYGDINESGEMTMAEQGERMATILDKAILARAC